MDSGFRQNDEQSKKLLLESIHASVGSMPCPVTLINPYFRPRIQLRSATRLKDSWNTCSGVW